MTEKINLLDNVINKFIDQHTELSKSALQIATEIDRADIERKNANEKEKVLGFDNANKPYGKLSPKEISNEVLVYRIENNDKQLINEFIAQLENFQKINKAEEKRDSLLSIKNLSSKLENLNTNPRLFIINEDRAKTWELIERDFFKNILRFDADMFIDHIKILYLKYKEDITYIKNYYKRQEQAYIDISQARKIADNEAVATQKKILSEYINPKIAQLLIDTGKAINSAKFDIDKIMDVLTDEQRKILESFLPAISEYYIDQTYAISGGVSYTEVCDKFRELQVDINNNKPIGTILNKVDKLDPSMQHLYLLHWIAESMLKDIMECYAFSCSIGFTVLKYNKTYPESKASLLEIKKGIRIRNDIAHNGLIWDPARISSAIKLYREYIKNISEEQSINLSKYKIRASNRELSREQKDRKIHSFISSNLNIDSDALHKINNKLYNNIKFNLERNNWNLNKKEIEKYKYLIDREKFAFKYFGQNYEEVISKLKEHDEINNTKRVGTFTFAYKKQNDISFNKNIRLIKEVIKS